MVLAGPCALYPVAVSCRAEPVVKRAGRSGAAATADNVGAVAAVDAAVIALMGAGGKVVVEAAVAEQVPCPGLLRPLSTRPDNH